MVGEDYIPVAVAGAFGAFFIAFFVVMLLIYIYVAIALMAIAKKTDTKDRWLAFIPIANIYLMTQVAKLPGWYTLGFLLAFVPFIGQFAFMALMAFIWWKIAEKIGRPGWWGLLTLIPAVNLVVMGIMAWGK